MIGEGKFQRGKRALNESRPTREKTANARRQANEAKTILHMHKRRNSKHHSKVAIKTN